MTLILPFYLFGCGNQTESSSVSDFTSKAAEQSSVGSKTGNEADSAETGADSESETGSDETKILVAYFSATGTTRTVAEEIAETSGGDLFEIVPAEPYSDEDLDYGNDSCRANREQNDDNARPAISNAVENIEDYDVVFIGHPIWWGKEPKIIDTFLESYDFSGKTMIDFCTSGGSGIGQSESSLKEICPDSEWLEGRRLGDSSEVAEWLESLELNTEKREESVMYITVNGRKLTADLADNSSAEALKELLKDDPLTIDMSDYSNFEKVGGLGAELPRNDEQITTEAGDLILYQGNQFVIYYDTNSWDFTRLGKIRDISQEELKELLGGGDVTVTLSLE